MDHEPAGPFTVRYSVLGELTCRELSGLFSFLRRIMGSVIPTLQLVSSLMSSCYVVYAK